MNKRKFNDAPEFIKKIDWSDLRGQKTVLIKLANAIRDTPPEPYKKDGVDMTVIMMPKETEDVLEGILGLIDAVQDYAVDVLGIPEIHIFDFEEEEEREKSTPQELFAIDAAQRIFDELCESDGFHRDDEMSEEFIASIMADKMHADIIKAMIRNQILEDLKKHPLEFKYDVTAPTGIPIYDSNMREDYEGIATNYCREQFNKNKTKSLWLCPNCGSDNIEMKVWRHANYFEPDNNDRDDSTEDDECYCRDCEKTGDAILSDVKYTAKIVGFQVIGDDFSNEAGGIHPEMDGSFCLYNLSQAKDMINNQSINPEHWRLLAIWSGDVEEPTIMFEGNPRD